MRAANPLAGRLAGWRLRAAAHGSPMEMPSAIKLAKPSVSTTSTAMEPPTMEAMVENVVMMPSMPPKTMPAVERLLRSIGARVGWCSRYGAPLAAQ